MEELDDAGLHVEDSGSGGDVVGDRPGQLRERSERPDGVEMAQEHHLRLRAERPTQVLAPVDADTFGGASEVAFADFGHHVRTCIDCAEIGTGRLGGYQRRQVCHH